MDFTSLRQSAILKSNCLFIGHRIFKLMSDSSGEYREVRTRNQFVDLIFDLLDENDAIQWPNDSAYSFLQALAAWIDAPSNHIADDDQPTWQLFADALQAATGKRN